MFESIILLSVLVADCADELGGLGDKNMNEKPTSEIIKALATRPKDPLNEGIPKNELEKYFSFPSRIDGDLATLASKPNLRIYGISDFERGRIERIEVWAFDRIPLRLATIFVDQKPSDREAIQTTLDNEFLYIALHRHFPELLQLMFDQKVLTPFRPEEILKNSFLVDELLDEFTNQILENDGELPTWNKVFWELAAGYELERRGRWRDHFATERIPPPKHLSDEAKKYAVPNPPNREPNRAKFDGWLAADHTAIAILGFKANGSFRGWNVSLHPKLRSHYHPAFPNLAQRIGIEQRFEVSWLNRANLIYVELQWPSQHHVFGDHGAQILLFENESDLPHGIEFFRLDPTTGTRLSEKPELIELTDIEKAAKRASLEKAMSQDPLPKDGK